MEGCAAVALVGAEVERACQSVRRQDEIGCSHTILVGGHLLFADHLMVGIAERQPDGLLADSRRCPMVHHLIVDERHMHLLAGTIDRAVGKELDMFLCGVRSAIVECRRIEVLRREGRVVVRKGIVEDVFPPLLEGHDGLTLLVAADGRLAEVLLIVGVRLHIHLSVGHGLSRRHIDNGYAQLAVGHLLGQHVEIADVEQFLLGRHLALVGYKLYEVDPMRQRLDAESIAREFPFLEVGERLRLFLQRSADGLLAYLRQMLAERQRVIALEVNLLDAHRQRLDVADGRSVELYHLICGGYGMPTADGEARTDQLLAAVAQFVHAFPRAPASQGLVDIGYLLAGLHIVARAQELIACDGHLATLREVAVAMDERVELVDVRLPLLQRRGIGIFRLLRQFQGREQGCTAVARTVVVVVHRLEVARPEAQHVEQVVVEDAAVYALLYHRREVGSLVLGEQLGLAHRLTVILLAVAEGVALLVVVVGHNLCQHAVVHCSQQRLRLLGLGSLPQQPVHGRFERVGSHLHHERGVHQLRLQQMAILLLALGLGDNLLEHLHTRLREVALLQVVHLLPELVVTISKQL